jgi:hypothetical protein
MDPTTETEASNTNTTTKKQRKPRTRRIITVRRLAEQDAKELTQQYGGADEALKEVKAEGLAFEATLGRIEIKTGMPVPCRKDGSPAKQAVGLFETYKKYLLDALTAKKPA